jgi:hypothetical protein
VSGDDLVKIFGMLWKLIAALAFLASAYAGALYAGQVKLDEDKLDNIRFDQYVAAENKSDKAYRDAEMESDRLYRAANSQTQERIFKAIDIIQKDVKTLLMK